MRAQIFVNLVVSDLKRSMAFYSSSGFVNEPRFTDETAACMKYSEEIFVMLLTPQKFSEFTKKKIADTRSTASAILSISVENAEQVNNLLKKVLASGGKEPLPAKDYGFMNMRSFEDPDGHLWEVFHMDMSKMPANN